MIVKPTDSAGSKGVTRVDSINEYEAAVKYAFEKSIKGHIIVEQYLEKVGCSSDTDSFLLDGKFRFMSFWTQIETRFINLWMQLTNLFGASNLVF